MKNRLIISLLAIFLAAGCENREWSGIVTLTKQETFDIGQGLTLQADTIIDYRCPKNASCITGGLAYAVISLRSNTGSASTRLCIGPDCRRDRNISATGRLTLNGRTVGLELLEVLPIRDTSKPETAWPEKAVLRVE